MARDLNQSGGSAAPSPDTTDVTGEPRTQSPDDLATDLAADAYNIVVALVFLSLSYWALFRSLPVEWFTLGLAAVVLIALNVVVMARDW